MPVEARNGFPSIPAILWDVTGTGVSPGMGTPPCPSLCRWGRAGIKGDLLG